MATSTCETKYRYDAAGNRSRIVYPSGATIDYTSDYAGRPVTAAIVSGSTLVSSATYLPFGPPLEIVYGNGTRQTMEYDSRYRMTWNTLTGPQDVLLLKHHYGYDHTGNITSIEDVLDSRYNRTFGYDDLNRLVTANTGATDGNALWGSGAFSYDAMGNLMSSRLGEPRQTLGHAAYFTYEGTTPKLKTVRRTSFESPDEPMGESGAGVMSAQSIVGYHDVTYDAAGNELQYLATRTYSSRNLLESVSDVGELPEDTRRLEYGYDGRAVRVKRSELQPDGSKGTRHYTYSPELNLLSITGDDRSNVWSTGLPGEHQFVWFNGRPLAQLAPDFLDVGPRWYFNDHLGTPLVQTHVGGGIVWHAEYEPFGDIWAMRVPGDSEEPSSVPEQPLRFPGQELAMKWEGTEERYNIFRWYRAGWGRYTQADPIGLVGREFPYASNNPILHTDMLGLRDTGTTLQRPVIRTVCRAGARRLGWVAGRSLGLLSLLLASGSELSPREFEAERGECDGSEECEERRRRCRPCIPPVGTIAYREDTNPRSRPHRGVPPPHWKLYKMSQNPLNCRCFWDDIPDNRGGFGPSPPPPGTVPITPAEGGAFW